MSEYSQPIYSATIEGIGSFLNSPDRVDWVCSLSFMFPLEQGWPSIANNLIGSVGGVSFETEQRRGLFGVAD